MHRVAHQNFCVINQTTLKSHSSLITEISFQKNDDISVCLEKLLLQDQISSIYLKPQIELIEECNKFLSFENFTSQIQSSLNEETNLAKALSFWDNLLEKEEENNMKQADFQVFSKKFIKVCSQSNNQEILMNIYREIMKADRIFWEGYLRDEEKQNFLHSEEVKSACEKNMKQNEIEGLVNMHLKRLEELEVMYKEQFMKKQFQKKKDFMLLIEKLYTDSSQKTFTIPFCNDSLGNLSVKSGKSDEQMGSKNGDSEIKKNSINKEKENFKENNEKNKKKEKMYELRLCLGTQKKYEFKIKLRESDYKDYLPLKEEKLMKYLKTSSNEIKNYIYGIGQKALVNLISLKPEEGNHLSKMLKFKNDLFFDSFEDQIQEINQKTKGKTKQSPLLSKEKPDNTMNSFTNGDVLITKHGNIKTRIVFNVVYESFSEFQNDSFLNWFRKIVRICNENQIKSLNIPLEFFFNGNLNNYYSIKGYGDLLLKIIKMVKREINNFAMEYATNHFIKNINILIPNGKDNLANLFERSKEIAKNVFE